MNRLVKPLSPGMTRLVERARNRRSVSGQAFFLLLICLVILFGITALAVDYGMQVFNANMLQKACDAAALAGALDMVRNPTLNTSPSNTHATTQAQLLGTLNHQTISTVTFSGNSTKGTVTVSGSLSQIYYFAPVLGIKSGSMTRQAKAEYNPITGVNGGVPLGMTINDYNTYLGGGSFSLNLIRNQDTAFNPGDAVALSLQTGNNGKSPEKWEDDLKNGSPVVGNIGDVHDLNSINDSLGANGNGNGGEYARLNTGLSGRIGTSFAIFILDTVGVTNGTSNHPILGIAVVTLGDVNDSGKLTLTLPRELNGLSGGVYDGATTGPTNAYKTYLVP